MPTININNDDGSTSYRLINGRKLTIQKKPDVDPHDVPGTIVSVALDILNNLADKTHSVETDATLSEVGRWRALESIQRKSITTIAQMHGQLAYFAESLNQRMLDHLAIPALAPNALAIALEDAEIRTWWKQAPPNDKAAVMANATTDPQSERVIAAVLRSPIPVAGDAEIRSIREVWTAVRNGAALDVHEKIEGERLSLEWGQLSLAIIASAMHQLVLTWCDGGKPAVLRIMQEDADPRVQKGAQIFGYAASEISRMQRTIAVERMATH